MNRVRVIPVLLIQKGGLVKSVKFKDHKYVGDPINAVKIFNEKEVDEIIILDISATSEEIGPNIKKIKEITSEAFMPLGYGGGISKLEEIMELIEAGVEKVIINSAAFHNPQLITAASQNIGSQSVVVSVDIKKNIWGKYKVYVQNGSRNTNVDPVEYAKQCEANGAGEIFLNSIERDGTYTGYDLELLEKITSVLTIPVIACGGAGSVKDFSKAIKTGHASAVAAGSFFVFQRPHQAVLISYPSQAELRNNLYGE